jgi:hypothetical protein
MFNQIVTHKQRQPSASRCQIIVVQLSHIKYHQNTHAHIPPSPKANICLILFLIKRYDYSQQSAAKEQENEKVVCAVGILLRHHRRHAFSSVRINKW